LDFSNGWKTELRRGLALQLQIPFDVSISSGGLVGASPGRPCNDGSWLDPSFRETDGDAPYFLDRPADQWWRSLDAFGVVVRRFVFGGGVLFAWRRMAAIMAKAT
jgi:hypothetical protein